MPRAARRSVRPGAYATAGWPDGALARCPTLRLLDLVCLIVHNLLSAVAKDKSEKTPKSSKKEKKEAVVEEVETPGNESSAFKRAHVCAIANPLASEKLTKKVLKLVKKAAKRKQIKRGVKEVIKSIRKGGKGVVLIAGDISPIDVITPLPVLCEGAGLPYVYVPSKEELGQAGLTKRPTSCMLVLSKPGKGAAKSTEEEDKEFEGAYSEVSDAVKAVQPVF